MVLNEKPSCKLLFCCCGFESNQLDFPCTDLSFGIIKLLFQFLNLLLSSGDKYSLKVRILQRIIKLLFQFLNLLLSSGDKYSLKVRILQRIIKLLFQFLNLLLSSGNKYSLMVRILQK